MYLSIITKESNLYTWDAFGIHFPWPTFGEEIYNEFGDSVRRYGISFPTKIQLTKQYGFAIFTLKVLGFGFSYVKQWDY